MATVAVAAEGDTSVSWAFLAGLTIPIMLTEIVCATTTRTDQNIRRATCAWVTPRLALTTERLNRKLNPALAGPRTTRKIDHRSHELSAHVALVIVDNRDDYSCGSHPPPSSSRSLTIAPLQPPNTSSRLMWRSTQSHVAANPGPSPRRPGNVASACSGVIRPTIALQNRPGAMCAPGTMNLARTPPPPRPTQDTMSPNAPTASANMGPHPAPARFTGPISTRRSSLSSRNQDSTGLEKPDDQDAASLRNIGSWTTRSHTTRTFQVTTMGFIEAPALPDTFQYAPNPRYTALELFDRLLFASQGLFWSLESLNRAPTFLSPYVP